MEAAAGKVTRLHPGEGKAGRGTGIVKMEQGATLPTTGRTAAELAVQPGERKKDIVVEGAVDGREGLMACSEGKQAY